MPEDFHGPRQTIRPLKESQESQEREHFDLRLKFASAIVAKTGTPLSQVVPQFTDLRQLFFNTRSPAETSEEAAKWRGYLEKLDTEKDPTGLLDKTCKVYKELEPYREALPALRQFGNFDFGYDPRDQSIHLAFSEIKVNQRSDEPSPLSPERRHELIQNLEDMFAYIKTRHPEAKTVHGESWLYNRRSYRLLFPPEYTAPLDDPEVRQRRIANSDFNRMRWWGQFIDKGGGVNEDRKKIFMERIEHLDVNNIGNMFPLPVLRVSGDINKFYERFLHSPA